jgi:hypothetical protein
MNTSPLDKKALVLMLKYDSEKFNDKIYDSIDSLGYFDFEDGGLIEHLNSIGKYFGIDFTDTDNLDYLNEFLHQNMWKLAKDNYNYQEYVEPKLKKFIVNASEDYHASISDNYKLNFKGYTENYARFLITNGEITIADGEFTHQDIHDTWDVDYVIHDIEEIKSDITENTKKSNKLYKKDFLSHIEDENDVEMLDLMIQVIEKRKKELNF